MSGFYDEDLAHVHDVGWGFFAASAAPAVVARLRAAGFTSGVVLELACGSGILSRELVDAGFDVVGVDLSAAMLEIASRRVPEARFVHASVLDAELPPCVAAVAIGEGLGYLQDPRLGDDEQLARLFARVYSSLAPGGLFLLDLVERDEPRRAWSEGSGYVICVELTTNGGTFARRIVLFREVDGSWRRSSETHRGRLQPRVSVLELLAAAGFATEVLETYAEDAPLRDGVVGYAATRPR